MFIPVGVAHGFYAITACTLTYVVNNYYDGGNDEFGVAWNDPALEVPWNIAGEPLISPRDAANRLLKDIPSAELPK